MADAARTIWFAQTAGWFEFDPAEGLVKVDLHDPRVVEAKKLGVKFLVGRDMVSMADQTSLFTKLREQVANLTTSNNDLLARESKAVDERDQALAEARDANAARVAAEHAKTEAERNLGIRTGDLTAARTRITQLEGELGTEKAARTAAEARTGGADPAEITRLSDEVSNLTGQVNTLTGQLRTANTDKATLLRERDEARTERDARPAAAPPPRTAPRRSGKELAMSYGIPAVVGLVLGAIIFGWVFKSTPPDVATLQTKLDNCNTQLVARDVTIKERDATIKEKDGIIQTRVAGSPSKQEPPKEEKKCPSGLRRSSSSTFCVLID